MKKLCLLFSLLFIAFSSFAQVKKVALHHNGVTSLFTGNDGFKDAVTSAVSGDTIYLPGGLWNPTNIDKRLTIYGAGHYPDSTQATGVTTINSGFTFQTGSDSSLLQGVDISGSININATDYVTINRCRFSSSTITDTSEHITFSENVINQYINVNNRGNFITIRNNFIGTDNGTYRSLNNIIQGALIENNVFNKAHRSTYSNDYGLFYSVNGSLIRNNVIMHNSAYYLLQGTCSNNTFDKNVFTLTPNYGTNTTTNNYENVVDTTIFVNWTALSTFSYNEDYHLQSPATYLGTDSTQVGMYGGANPYKLASVPANPHIRENNTANQTDAAGNLTIDIKVGAQDR